MATFQLRSATPDDTATIFQLIQTLAEYEKLAHEVTGSLNQLQAALFGDRPAAEVLLADVEGEAAGFALFFPTYSSFEGKPGIYLEDLFVRPTFRRQGIAKALLSRLAKLVLERQGCRLEWAVLDWNTPAIEFYQRIGAEQLGHRCLCRLTGDTLTSLAERGRTQVVRTPQPRDVREMVSVLQQNAEFHESGDRFLLTSGLLERAVFESPPSLEVVLAEMNAQICGISTFYTNFSTFLTQAGLHLDDLLVQSGHRRQGFGTSLLVQLARTAVKRQAGRLEWYVYRDNHEAIAFYQQLGAKQLPEWIPNRVSERALVNLARGVV
ncbi:MAG: GNAT family N-acetyltransferase [Cyanobacteria bacterium P01_A01_bin.3]